MPVYGQSDLSQILVDGFSIAGYIITLDESTEALVEQTDGMGDSWVENTYVGMQRLTLNMDGFYSDTALATNEALLGTTTDTKTGTTRLVLLTPAGNTLGKTAVGFAGVIEAGYTRTATRGALHKAKALWVGTGAKTDLIVIQPMVTKTTSSNSDATSYDGTTVSSANGGIFHVQVTAFAAAGGGGTNVLLKWRDSADNSSFAAISGATATITTAPSAARLTPSGTIRRYWSVSWTFDGSGGSPSVTFIAAAQRS